MDEYYEETPEEKEEREKKYTIVNKLAVGTLGTSIGKKYLKELKRAFVDRPIYIAGLTPDQVAYRQGQCDVITQMIKVLEKAQGELDG